MNSYSEMEIIKFGMTDKMHEHRFIDTKHAYIFVPCIIHEEEEEPMSYNKKYYEQNKTRLQEKYKSRVKCPLCDREVAKSSLTLHYKTKICKSRQEIKLNQIINNNIINTELDNYYTNK
jgi:hypothetical protein